ncbi:MAG: DNA polymerase III subunit epsilon [Dongiaceae bacterium]
MREVILDTETTGLDPRNGDRIIEIACIELLNHLPTGRTWQAYVNPEREVSVAALDVHGITDSFLRDKPVFAEIVADFLEFIGDAPLVIHNAEFDLGFLNAELGRLGFPPLPASRGKDTVALARRKFPGSPASLDALCKRFNIDNSARTKHGALLDAELLADVYLELVGGRQAGLELAGARATLQNGISGAPAPGVAVRPARPHAPSAAELAAHETLLRDISDPIWRR